MWLLHKLYPTTLVLNAYLNTSVFKYYFNPVNGWYLKTVFEYYVLNV